MLYDSIYGMFDLMETNWSTVLFTYSYLYIIAA